MKRFHIVSLGCPKNRVDSEAAAAVLMAAGYLPTESPEEASVLLVNTCSFITSAREESIHTLVELAELKKKGERLLVALGCLSQEAGEELLAALPELDLAIPGGEVARLPELLAGARGLVSGQPCFVPAGPMARRLSQSTAFAYLKIADGCSRSCGFCTIPHIKGPTRSRPIGALVAEATQLAEMGVRELVLVAQDLSQYGLPGERNLLRLLDRLERVPGIEWIRLMYLYPEGVSDGLLGRIGGGSKVVPYLDLPLQHIDGGVLRAMKRRVGEGRLRRIVELIRTTRPEIALRTTFIVGHPGEDESAFSQLLDFVREVRFEHLGVFAYSREEGTPSAAIPGQLPPSVARRRERALMGLQRRISAKRQRSLVGQRTKVLAVGPSDEHDWVWVGRTAEQAPEVDGVVYLDGFAGEAGQFVECEIVGAADYDLVARPLDEMVGELE